MDPLYKIHLRIFRSVVHDLAPSGYVGTPARPAWSPNVTIHRYDRCYVLLVELAGVDRTDVSVQSEPYRLVVSGTRRLGPTRFAPDGSRQILALEIDEGPFRREITFPEEVVPEGVVAEQVNGVLQIELPLRDDSSSPAPS